MNVFNVKMHIFVHHYRIFLKGGFSILYIREIRILPVTEFYKYINILSLGAI